MELRLREWQGLPTTHLSAQCLFIPMERGGIPPCALWHCPHSHLAPAVLCLGLWGQLQAGEGREGYCGALGAAPAPPQPHKATFPPSDGRCQGQSFSGWRSTGFWGGALGLPHLPLLMASVCTWTVWSCHELSWNMKAWTQFWKRPVPSQTPPQSRVALLEEAGIEYVGDLSNHPACPSVHSSGGKAGVQTGGAPT